VESTTQSKSYIILGINFSVKRDDYFWKIAQCEYGQEGCLPTCSITDNHQFPVMLSNPFLFDTGIKQIGKSYLRIASFDRLGCPALAITLSLARYSPHTQLFTKSSLFLDQVLPLSTLSPRLAQILTACQFKPSGHTVQEIAHSDNLQCSVVLCNKPRSKVQRERGGRFNFPSTR
jgi:hypothetical protein